MPEATEDAVFLIATSWQALGRATQGDERTETCNCTVVLLFAAFYIEANLSHIIEKIYAPEEMKKIVEGMSGLYPKLSWFYNEFVKDGKATSKKDFQQTEFQEILREEIFERFPGLKEIKQFRNDVAHGKIDKSLANLKNAEKLRGKAKAIVKDLFEIAEKNGCKIERTTTYEMVVLSEPDSEDVEPTKNVAT